MCVPTLVLSLFSPNALEARRSAHALERRPQASRRALLLGAAAVPLLAASSPATAAFGPAVGSAASQPPITPLDVEGWLALTPEKLLQRARSVSGSQARSLQEQIDDAFSAEKLEALIASLQEQGTVAASPALASELEVLAAPAEECGGKGTEKAAQGARRALKPARRSASGDRLWRGAGSVADEHIDHASGE